MRMVCLDLETTLVPEFWIEIARATGIEALRRTTRDEPDYSLLMHQRIGALRSHSIDLACIQAILGNIEPLPGARAFLDELRSLTQVIILSDTFGPFASAIAPKLNYPTMFYNELLVGADGMVQDFRMRVEEMKLASVRALQSIGYEVIAVGDSFNDVEMIREAAHGFLIHGSEAVVSAHPDIPAFDSYTELLAAIKELL